MATQLAKPSADAYRGFLSQKLEEKNWEMICWTKTTASVIFTGVFCVVSLHTY